MCCVTGSPECIIELVTCELQLYNNCPVTVFIAFGAYFLRMNHPRLLLLHICISLCAGGYIHTLMQTSSAPVEFCCFCVHKTIIFTIGFTILRSKSRMTLF